MKKFNLLAAFVAVSMAGAASADDYVVLDRTADDFDRIEIQPDGTLRTVDVVSREVHVPVQVIEEQRTRTQLGYGGLFIANSIAVETGRPFDEIVALKRSGRGWGDIAKQYGVKVGPIVSRAHRVDHELRGNGKLKHEEKKAEKFANGHDNRGGGGHGKAKGQHGGGHGQGKAKGHGNGHGKH